MYGGTPLEDAMRHNQKVTQALLEIAGGVPGSHVSLAVKIEANEKQRKLQIEEKKNKKAIQYAKSTPEFSTIQMLDSCEFSAAICALQGPRSSLLGQMCKAFLIFLMNTSALKA